MDRRRRMRLWVGARRLTLGALLCLSFAACGGANEDDVATITGNPPDSGKPTVTLTFPPAPPPTEPPPPIIAPAESTLFIGFGAPPLNCNGSRGRFTVIGDNPPFTLKATGGCLDPSAVATSGGEFEFIAGDDVGEFAINATDSAGRQTTVPVNLRGSPAEFIDLQLAVQQMQDNGDGTFTSVIGAILTDEDGVAVPNGVPVAFSIIAPAAGVSVTSPGFTNEAAPCTVAGAVPQPGQALSCVTFAGSLQGSTITVRVQVRTENGGVLEETRTVQLPTSPNTPIPTTTPTVGTATPTRAAAHIDLELAVNRVTDNGDGTFTTIVGALITDSRGVTIGDGIRVEFDVVVPISGVSVTSPGFTNQPQPCTVDFTVLPQPGDALTCVKYVQSLQGATVAIHVSVETPEGVIEDTQEITLPDLRPTATPTITPTATPTVTPTATVTPTSTPAAAFIALQLAENQASDNGDGTLSAVLGALVTDALGVTIGDGVPVTFNLVAPVSGVSLTSPGFTNQPAPCTLGFTVVPQPGDALSCVKYTKSLQGTTIDVRASVSTPSGVIEATVTITLPDFRPTATPTATPTSTPTQTPTPTITPTATPAAMFIAIQLAANRASDNGDGTLSTVIGAIVADANGVAIGDGVAVTFNIVAPSAGVTLTSPGFTGQAPPCTLDFTVVPQPGDALSCVKYLSNLQGTAIEVRATVSTPSGPIGVTSTIVLPDLRATATPTNTPTSTPTVTPTSTITPTATPAAMFIALQLAENQASDNGDGTLSAVIGAVVTDANGVTVGDGVPVTFNLVQPIAGVSLTSPGFTNEPPPCTLGFTVVPQPGDALSCVKYTKSQQGTTIDVRASVASPAGTVAATITITLPDFRPTATPTATSTPTVTPTPTATPAAAFIALQLAENQASDNGDGTLSAVIGALVTDANGVTIGDGVPVTFNLVPPIAGVSLTSPGFTGQPPPCTLGFTVVPQPGDALSCVKYTKSQQGTTINVRASVSTPSGIIQATVTITLPDFRPTATPTPTSTPTPTITPTATPAAMFIAIQLAANRASDNGDGTLSTVIGAIVADANGVAVGNGVAVTFNIIAPAAGVTLTSPGFTGQAPPCTLGFTVVPQPGDALSCVKYTSNLQGTSIVVRATVSTPTGPIGVTSTIVLPDLRPTATPTPTSTPTPTPTATPTPGAVFITVQLGTDQVSDNGDGTLSTVIGALVTDAQGVTIGDGVAVEFSLVNPVAGVSVTSPGFTHLQAPCTLDFTVIPQPGDALSCVKYSKDLQGAIVTVRARVRTAAGGTIEDTAVVLLPDLRPTPTTTPTVTPTPVPTGIPFSVQFIDAVPAKIGVRASGLPEQAVLTFKVTDATANPVAGVPVTFTLTDIDDETLVPLEAITDAEGLVQTTLTSGVRAATLRVFASADVDENGTPDISAQSIAVSVFGAPPVLNRFSVAAERLNVAGRRFFGIENPITAFVNDRFGNAVPEETAVSFISNGASVVDPDPTTVQGRAIATLITEAEVPPTGIVTVLAFTRGEEQFLDNNGNGVFDQGVDTIIKENLPEPFIDFRPCPPGLPCPPPSDVFCPILPPSSLCNAAFNTNTEFELFVDENHDGIWGVQGTVGVWDNNLLIFDAIPVTFSGTVVEPLAFQDEALTIPLGNNFGLIPDGGSLTFFLTVHDDLQNPLVEGSTIEVTVQGGTVFPGVITLADSQSFNQLIPGVTVFAFSVGDATPQEMPAQPPRFTSIVVNITSENGSGSFVIATGSID